MQTRLKTQNAVAIISCYFIEIIFIDFITSARFSVSAFVIRTLVRERVTIGAGSGQVLVQIIMVKEYYIQQISNLILLNFDRCLNENFKK